MKIRVRNALDSIKYSEKDIEADISKPFTEIIRIMQESLNLKTNQINYLIVRAEGQVEISDYNKSLRDYNFKEEDSIQLENKQSFVIPAYLIYVLSYMGPPVVFLIFVILHRNNLDLTKLLAVVLTMFHYFRRIYESFYVFKLSVEKFNALGLLAVGSYYWLLYGVYCGYSIFNNSYEDESFPYVIKLVIFTVLFLFAEYYNYYCHSYLANLKMRNNNQRAIPRGGMFEYVTCAHYFWELLSWVFFSFIVNTLASYVFVVASLFSMGRMAAERHRSQRNYFGDKYPQERKAFIPFIF